MNREQFISLPPSVALGILWDASPGLGQKLASVEPPKAPRPPKYDQAIYRKGGITWASEYDVAGLRYWQSQKAQSSKPEFAEKDAKAAAALGFWIAWRLVEPMTTWSGERNRQTVTARPPSSQPEVYPRDGAAKTETVAAPENFDDGSDLPF